MYNSNKGRGFTLIELMIVVAIIGILSAIAIPAYQSYTMRAKVTEDFSLLAAHKTGIAEYFGTFGELPSTLGQVNGSTHGTAATFRDFFGHESDLFSGVQLIGHPACAFLGCVPGDMYIELQAIQAGDQLRIMNNNQNLYVALQVRTGRGGEIRFRCAAAGAGTPQYNESLMPTPCRNNIWDWNF